MENLKNAQSSHWMAVIDKFPTLTFRLRGFTIPNITTAATEVPSTANKILKMPGSHVMYDDLSLDFFVDDSFKLHRSLYEWQMQNLKARVDEHSYSDILVYLGVNERDEQPKAKLNFTNCFPINLSPLVMDNENAEYNMYGNVLLKFTEFSYVDD